MGQVQIDTENINVVVSDEQAARLQESIKQHLDHKFIREYADEISRVVRSVKLVDINTGDSFGHDTGASKVVVRRGAVRVENLTINIHLPYAPQ